MACCHIAGPSLCMPRHILEQSYMTKGMSYLPNPAPDFSPQHLSFVGRAEDLTWARGSHLGRDPRQLWRQLQASAAGLEATGPRTAPGEARRPVASQMSFMPVSEAQLPARSLAPAGLPPWGGCQPGVRRQVRLETLPFRTA